MSTPVEGQRFGAGASVPIDVAATTDDAAISLIEVLIDGELSDQVEDEASASFTWSDAEGGWHSLSARVTDADGLSGTSDPVNIFVERAVTGALPIPAGLTAEALPEGEIELNWNPAFGSTPATGLVIESKEGVDGEWDEIAVLPLGSTQYPDTDLEPEWQYHYRIAAIDAQGRRSGYSAEAFALTPVRLPHYAVIDLGENLESSLVALRMLERRFLYAQAGGSFPSAAALDLRDSRSLSIAENGEILLQKSATSSDGSQTVTYYMVIHLDGRAPDYIGDPAFRAVKLGRDGSVAGALDRSVPGLSAGLRDSFYRGLSFWPNANSQPGTLASAAGRQIDVRAALWRPGTGVVEIGHDPKRFVKDHLALAREIPPDYHTYSAAWDTSGDGTLAVGSGTWIDLSYLPAGADLSAMTSFASEGRQHAMRWRPATDGWDTVGTLLDAGKHEMGSRLLI